MQDRQQVRREILQRLYQAHESDSPMVELEHLARELQVSFVLLRPGLDFLERRGYIELSKVRFGTREFPCACITDKGVDFLEPDSEFAPKTQTSIHHYSYYVSGDNYQVTLGDNNTNVVIGKGINQRVFEVGVGANVSFQELFDRVASQVSDFSKVSVRQDLQSYLDRLQATLAQDELDLGELQGIKRALVNFGGQAAAIALAVYANPIIAERIREATERLIGNEE